MSDFKDFSPGRFSIGKIQISRANKTLVMKTIDENLDKNKFGYICVTNARTTHLANQDSTYCTIQNNSFLTIPDGKPLVWIANNYGFKEVQKVSGIDLMDTIFKISVEKEYSHYFYGCSQNTIDLLQKKLKELYPNICIKRAVSPPFQPIEAYDIVNLAKEVNTLKPTFFWCGLGAPKQERLMALLQPQLEQSMSIGVGLAFEYFAGTVKRTPKSFEKLGLEWFYRLYQQPKKSVRFIKPFVFISKFLIKSKLKNYD
jgi:N-acetylglucosaminyldiphosphoundecaprenol N-acetyl-beta-D-mannosaminyltransferase